MIENATDENIEMQEPSGHLIASLKYEARQYSAIGKGASSPAFVLSQESSVAHLNIKDGAEGSKRRCYKEA